MTHEVKPDLLSADFSKRAIEKLPYGVYIADLHGHFLYGNSSAEKIVGGTREELVGTSFLRSGLFVPNEVLSALELLRWCILGKSTGPDEFTIRELDDRHQTVVVWTKPIQSNGETLILGTVILVDESAGTRDFRELIERHTAVARHI